MQFVCTKRCDLSIRNTRSLDTQLHICLSISSMANIALGKQETSLDSNYDDAFSEIYPKWLTVSLGTYHVQLASLLTQ